MEKQEKVETAEQVAVSDELDIEVKKVEEDPKQKEAEAKPEEKDKEVAPLFSSDSRFRTLNKELTRTLNTKFLKYFKRTKDLHKRNAGQEMSLFLAHFCFAYLKGLFEGMLQAGDRMAVRATFGEFENLYQIMRNESGIAKIAQKLDELGKEHDARVRKEDVPEAGDADVPEQEDTGGGGRERRFHGESDEVSPDPGHEQDLPGDEVAEGRDGN